MEFQSFDEAFVTLAAMGYTILDAVTLRHKLPNNKTERSAFFKLVEPSSNRVIYRRFVISVN